MEHVTWNDAVAFCGWLSERSGYAIRLPTEAEWEKAARGGLVRKAYPWGNEDPTCHEGSFNGAQFDDCGGMFLPAGSFAANGYGLHDMVGNVYEWVSDWYLENYYEVSPLRNPTGPAHGTHRVLRGGSWTSFAYELRVDARHKANPESRLNFYGFRCAWSVAPY